MTPIALPHETEEKQANSASPVAVAQKPSVPAATTTTAADEPLISAASAHELSESLERELEGNRLSTLLWPNPATEEAFFEAERMAALGVDLTRYAHIEGRDFFKPIISRKNRRLYWSLVKAYSQVAFEKLIGIAPSPVMMTHIVTTRCNYNCGFCSFADTLNAKTNELSLAEIEKVYTSVGDNLNVLVYSGGETTLNKELPEIIEAAYRLTPVQSVYIISNAWKPDLLFQITHRIMQRCPGLHLTWSLSIEGPKHHNNAVRHTKKAGWDAWQNTIDTMFGLKQMRRIFGYNDLDIQLCTVSTPDNAPVMEEWYDFVRDAIQPDKWNLNLMRKSVQMSSNELASFDERRANNTLEAFEQKYLKITRKVTKDVLSGKLKFLYHTRNKLDGAMKSAVDLISQEANRQTLKPNVDKPLSFCCKAGTMGGFIGSEGEVSGCEEFAMNPKPGDNKAFGNLRDVNYDFQALWQGEKAHQYRALVGKAPECNGCTLESQRNYPAILLSPKTMVKSALLAKRIK